jgi:type III secretion system-like peptide-binding chaperone
MGFFGTSKDKETERTIQECTKMVEEFLRKIGAVPDNQRLQDRDTIGWGIQRGSAVVFVLLNEHEKFNSLRVVSPIVYLPEEKILPFYRRCLEINMELITCALGVVDDRVVLVHERPLEGLDQEELEGTINFLSGVADDLDNKLANEFGAKIYTEVREGK